MLNKIKDFINSNKTFAIVGHIMPDGDSLCSGSALKLGLESLGKTAHFFCSHHKTMFNFLHLPITKQEQMLKKYDAVITVDTANIDRVDNMNNVLKLSKTIISLDHHIGSDIGATMQYVEDHTSSCCEVVYKLLTLLKCKITPDLSKYLYTGIATDTGCFKYSNASENTFFTVSKIFKNHVDTESINYHLFKKYTFNDLILLEHFAKHYKLFLSGHLCLVVLDRKFYKKHANFHSDFLNDYACYLENVKVGVVISEREKSIFKVSLRSAGAANVQKVAAHFGGGGHEKASGMIFKGKKKELIKQLIKQCERAISGSK